MANLTLVIPDKLHEKMRRHSDVRWSEVVRMAILTKIEDLELVDKLASRSRLSAKDALAISKEIDEEVAKKLGLV